MTEKAIKNISLLTDWYQYLLLKKTSLEIKTITGTLPLTFTAKGGNAVDWTIYGNSGGVGERTKNLLEITAETQTINGVTYTVNDDGTVTVSGTATADSNILLNNISGLPQGNYILSGEKDSSTTTVYPYVRGGGEPAKGDLDGTGVDFSMGNYTECKLYVARNFSGTVTVKPMIRLANTSPEFIPYGYEIPLTISQTGQTDKHYDIFVGDSPLTEGESVSLTSTGTDIDLFEGENTVSTTLTNKPEMTIKYK